MAAMLMRLPDWLVFASDATLVAMAGAGFVLAAVVSLVMDRRRHNRDRIGAPDRVGWVPWTTVFLLCAVMGAGLLAASLPSVMKG
jgi:hypothetical protein